MMLKSKVGHPICIPQGVIVFKFKGGILADARYTQDRKFAILLSKENEKESYRRILLDNEYWYVEEANIQELNVNVG